jgi:hypothetical protein
MRENWANVDQREPMQICKDCGCSVPYRFRKEHAIREAQFRRMERQLVSLQTMLDKFIRPEIPF